MKPTKAHFELFKKECLRLIDKYELNNWSVRFEMRKGNVLATTSRFLEGYTAVITMREGWNESFNPLTEKEIKAVAKHEITHLLLSRLALNAGSRFLTEDDMTESEEELVNKLSSLL